MARIPEPHYRKDRRLWYAQIGGVQHTLAVDADFRGDRDKSERAARRRFAQLLGEWEAARRAGWVAA